MNRVFKFILRYLFFWLFVFFLNRLVFLLSAVSFLQGVTLYHALGAFVAGWSLDISTVGYLLPIPGLLATLSFVAGKKWITRISNILVSAFIVIYCLTCFGELLLYREWTTKLTMQALLHFKNPAEVFLTAQVHTTILFFALTIIFSAAYIRIYLKKVSESSRSVVEEVTATQKVLAILVSVLVFLPVNFLMIRGGWRAIPISDSDAYYSKRHVLNDAAVNPLWSLGHNILEYNRHQESNPYLFMGEEEVERGMKEMMAANADTTERFLAVEKPNIVVLILEGFTAHALPHFGGDNFAPFLDSISRDGISFTNCYAAAYASDQGIPAVLSAYPSTPRVAITNQSSKTKDLPCISRDLKPLGYEAGFIFGGQLNYGNIKSYLYQAQFDVVLERSDFPERIPDGHLGIHDGDMAPLALQELNKAKQPFVYAWFTISSHSPYDIPVPMRKLTDSRENKYMNTVVYTDQAIRDFFAEARKQPWYSNTLFLVISDHSHFSQRDFSIEDKEYHRIVSFFYGDVIKPEFRGRKINKISSQVDFAPTLVKQFGLPADHYVFGKNLLNPQAPSFAYFDFHHGSGFVTDSCFISRRDKSADILINSCSDTSRANPIHHYHEVYLQKTFSDYLAR